MTSWRMGIEDLAGRIIAKGLRKIIALGTSDTGKTTLLVNLADSLTDRGRKVGLIDCDLGQSTVGPPMTVGLELPWEGKYSDRCILFPNRMVFIGEITPARAVTRVVEASLKLDSTARDEGYDHLLIDTSGMVEGPLAALLKRSKVRNLLPDLIVALERSEELGHILDALEEGFHRKVITLKPPPQIRRRERAERVRYRASLWMEYFREARLRTLDLSGMRVEKWFSSKKWPGEQWLQRGQLLGLNDREGFTLGLGKFLDRRGSGIQVLTPYAGSLEEIECISVSGHLLDEAGHTVPVTTHLELPDGESLADESIAAGEE